MTTHTPDDFLLTEIPGDPSPSRRDRLVVVHDPAMGTVIVRWRMGSPGAIWKCGACGLMNTTDCTHTFSAGIRLATDLLGLKPTISPVKENS